MQSPALTNLGLAGAQPRAEVTPQALRYARVITRAIASKHNPIALRPTGSPPNLAAS